MTCGNICCVLLFHRMDEISRMWGSFVEDDRKSVPNLCNIDNTIRKRNLVFEREKLFKNSKSCDKSHVQSEADRSKERNFSFSYFSLCKKIYRFLV